MPHQPAPPASWEALKNALAATPPEALHKAIDIQLQHRPSAEVYEFLHRSLDLSIGAVCHLNGVRPTSEIYRTMSALLQGAQLSVASFVGYQRDGIRVSIRLSDDWSKKSPRVRIENDDLQQLLGEDEIDLPFVDLAPFLESPEDLKLAMNLALDRAYGDKPTLAAENPNWSVRKLVSLLEDFDLDPVKWAEEDRTFKVFYSDDSQFPVHENEQSMHVLYEARGYLQAVTDQTGASWAEQIKQIVGDKDD